MRKCTRVLSGPDTETSLSHGAVVFKQISSRHPDGSIATFRGLKTEKMAGDENDGWKQICLCNRE